MDASQPNLKAFIQHYGTSQNGQNTSVAKNVIIDQQ